MNRKRILLFSLLFYSCLLAKVNLVWQGDRTNMWEESWLMELLSGIDVTIIDDGKYEKMIDNSIIIGHDGRKMDAYARKLHALGYKFGVIFTSDEQCMEKTDFYPLAQFVFRNIWHPKFLYQDNVVMFPLGYKNKFWTGGHKEIKPASQRKYTWSFAGRVGPHRKTMMQCMRAVPNSFVHQIVEWDDKRSLPTADYRDLLLNTIFIPCPGGAYTHDNFRVYESLECGCIPIIEKVQEGYFRNLFCGDIPFIVINNWDQAPQILNNFLANPTLLEQKRVQCYEWWQQKKKALNTEFVSIVNEKLNT